MIEILITGICLVTHLEAREGIRDWHEEPQCIGMDVMDSRSGWGANILSFDNSVNERTTAVGIVKTFELNETFEAGLTCGAFIGGYELPAYCLPFLRSNITDMVVFDASVAPIKGYPIMGTIKFRFEVEND